MENNLNTYYTKGKIYYLIDNGEYSPIGTNPYIQFTGYVFKGNIVKTKKLRKGSGILQLVGFVNWSNNNNEYVEETVVNCENLKSEF